MPSNLYEVMDENPNQHLVTNEGSAGCLCHELGGRDSTGPFLVFSATETDNIHSPFPVVCAPCVRDAFGMMQTGRDLPPPKKKYTPERAQVEHDDEAQPRL